MELQELRESFSEIQKRLICLEECFHNSEGILHTENQSSFQWKNQVWFKRRISKKEKFIRKDFRGAGILRKHVQDFINNVSLPGMRYLGESGSHRSDRFVWVLVLLISLVISFQYIFTAYVKWQESPILFTFNDTLTPVSQIPFPAVSICLSKKLKCENMMDVWNQCNVGTCDSDTLNRLANAGHLCDVPEEFDFNQSKNESLGGQFGVDNETNRNDDSEIVVGCNKLILSYDFVSEKEFECSKSFQTTINDGKKICFTFNMLPHNHMFKPGVIFPVIDQTNWTVRNSWSPDSMFEPSKYQKNTSETVTIPRYSKRTGKLSGLIINMKDTTNFAQLARLDIGLKSLSEKKVYLHSPMELPGSLFHTQTIKLIQTETNLWLRPQIKATSEELADYTPEKRRCHYSHELPLALFIHYTQRNCQIECHANCSLALCGCVSEHVPRFKSTKLCRDWISQECSFNSLITQEASELSDTMLKSLLSTFVEDKKMLSFFAYAMNLSSVAENSSRDDIIKEITDKIRTACSCQCPVPCSSVEYEVEEDLSSDADDDSPEPRTLLIFFKYPEYTSVIRKELIGFADFVANSGGLLGVFTGFSFLALCELVYYLTLKLWTTIKHSWEPYDCVLEDKED